MSLLSLLFPSWTFFDAVRLTPALQVRQLCADGSTDGWRDAVTPPRRRWSHVVFNPHGTAALAAQTLIETWARELMEQEEVPATGGASLPLVMALAEQSVAAPHGPASDEWQLRLIVRHADGGDVEVVYESGLLAMPVPLVS